MRRDLRQQVGGHIGIRAQAQQARRCFVWRGRGDELRDDIEAALHRIARDVRVIGAQIVLLQMVVAQPGAGLEVELDDLDVRGQAAFARAVRTYSSSG